MVDFNLKEIIALLIIGGVTIFVVAIAIAFSSNAVEEVDISIKEITGTSKINESQTVNYAATFTLNTSTVGHPEYVLDTSSIVITNETTAHFIDPANFSFTSLGVVNHTVAFPNYTGQSLNFTYDYSYLTSNSTRTIVNATQEGMLNLSNQFTSAGTIIGALVIVAMVLLLARFAGI